MGDSDFARADQSHCIGCWDEGWVERGGDPCAQPVPCPSCSPRLCEHCQMKRHEDCTGNAISEDHGGAVVRCSCRVGVHHHVPRVGLSVVLPPWANV